MLESITRVLIIATCILYSSVYRIILQPNISFSNWQEQQQPFSGRLSGTTGVGRYQKKHSPAHTHPGQRTSFITFLHLRRSMASSLFSLRAWQSSPTTSFQVLFGLPLMLEIYQKCPGYPTTDPLQKLPPIPLITMSVNLLKENQLGRKHDLLHSAHENKPVLRIAKQLHMLPSTAHRWKHAGLTDCFYALFWPLLSICVATGKKLKISLRFS